MGFQIVGIEYFDIHISIFNIVYIPLPISIILYPFPILLAIHCVNSKTIIIINYLYIATGRSGRPN